MTRILSCALLCFVTATASPAEAKPLRTKEAVRAALASAKEACRTDAGACHWLARLSERHPSLGVSYAQRVALSAKACRAGSSEACTDWGRFLYEGPAGDRDAERITKLWTDACDGGSPEWCRWLAMLFAQRQAEPQGTSKLLREARLQGAFEALLYDTARARALARPLLGDRDWTDEARFILACADLVEQQWEQAETKLAGHLHLDPAYAVLAELIKDRKAHETASWADSYARAWSAAGRPDLRGSMLFRYAPSPARHSLLEPKSTLGRFLLQRAKWAALRAAQPDEWPEPPSEALVKMAQELAKGMDPVAQRLALTVLLAGDAKARASAHTVIEAWQKQEPGNQVPALLAWRLKYADGSLLTEEELAGLEAIAQMPEYRVSPLSAYQRALPEVMPYLPTAGFELAMEAAQSTLFTDTATVLLQRAQSVHTALAPERWKRLVGVLHNVGQRMRGAGSPAELDASDALLDFEAESKEGVKERRLARQERHRRWGENTEDALRSWPFFLLQDAWYDGVAAGETAFRAHLDALLTPPPPPKEPLPAMN